MKLLGDVQILNLAYNAPGPVAAQRLQNWGARVIKVEPPGGDPLERYCKDWYQELKAGQTVISLDLKHPAGRAELEGWLATSDLLITSVRLESLTRLGLGWPDLHVRHPHLCHVAITGYAAAYAKRPGHDLTYQAQAGLLDPPAMPRTLVVDLAGGERAAGTALALLLGRARGQEGQFMEMPLYSVALEFAAPRLHGLTTPEGMAGGAFSGYRLYPAKQGWIAVAALEDSFWMSLATELGFSASPTAEQLTEAFQARSAVEWQAWADERLLPLVAVL